MLKASLTVARAAATGTDVKTFKGQQIEFQDEGSGTIIDETEDSIFIESQFFTGWMFKAEYFDLLGIED